MWFVAVVATLIVGYTGAYVASPEVRYLHRAGVEESKILASRRDIAKLVVDTAVPEETRAQLRLVLEARDFAATLGLEAKETYTRYADVGRDTLLLVVTASGADCICPVTWKYPIAGRVPYKGFFDAAEGRKFAAELEGKGYDVNVRPSAAFSTLGWFNDPLLSTALERDSMELVALVLHEIAHNTLWVKGNVAFNESYAQLVGYRGAEAYFRSKGDTALARRAADRWHDEAVFGDFYGRLIARADSFYATHPDSAALRAGKIALGEWARADFEGPVAAQLRSVRITPSSISNSRPINNARLVGVTLYRTHLDRFEAWYQAHGADIKVAAAALDSAMVGVEGDSAWSRLGAPCLSLSDNATSIRGTVGVERHFGAPNYGEDTLRDARLRIPVLRLSSPAMACRDPSTRALFGAALDSLSTIATIQLQPAISAIGDSGREVIVFGRLHPPEIGPEFLPVVMSVDSLRPAP